MKQINDALSLDYPGRGIIMGLTPDGNNGVIAYFIMGRSENSRNRIFVKSDNNGIRTQAFDESKVSDPSLIIYPPVKVDGNRIIVTNGAQTDGIAKLMDKRQLTFEQALQFIEFEPDPPILTPRISGMIKIYDDKFNYRLSILKSDNGNENHALRYFYEYETPENGKGHFIHTYKHNAEVPPSFEGEPKKVEINGGIDEFSEMIWNGLNEDFKVSLYVSYINYKNREITEKIINKNI